MLLPTGGKKQPRSPQVPVQYHLVSWWCLSDNAAGARINLILVLVLSLIVTPLIFIYSDQAVYTGCYGDPLDCVAAFGPPFFVPKKTPQAEEPGA